MIAPLAVKAKGDAGDMAVTVNGDRVFVIAQLERPPW